MPVSALLLGASAAVRAASLNLCSDEYLLLLADPEQVVGVSYLARDARETRLWRLAQQYPGNRGSIEDVLPLRPTLLVTMGGGGRSTFDLAQRVRIKALDLKLPGTLDEVVNNLRVVGDALGQSRRADGWIARLDRLRRNRPPRASDTIWVTGGGLSLSNTSLGAQWMRLAGYQQRALSGGRLTLETLLASPPNILLVSDYRAGQTSRGETWLKHPIVRGAKSRHVATDGRPWTCLGPLMIPEIEHLRKTAQ